MSNDIHLQPLKDPIELVSVSSDKQYYPASDRYDTLNRFEDRSSHYQSRRFSERLPDNNRHAEYRETPALLKKDQTTTRYDRREPSRKAYYRGHRVPPDPQYQYRSNIIEENTPPERQYQYRSNIIEENTRNTFDAQPPEESSQHIFVSPHDGTKGSELNLNQNAATPNAAKAAVLGEMSAGASSGVDARYAGVNSGFVNGNAPRSYFAADPTEIMGSLQGGAESKGPLGLSIGEWVGIAALVLVVIVICIVLRTYIRKVISCIETTCAWTFAILFYPVHLTWRIVKYMAYPLKELYYFVAKSVLAFFRPWSVVS